MDFSDLKDDTKVNEKVKGDSDLVSKIFINLRPEEPEVEKDVSTSATTSPETTTEDETPSEAASSKETEGSYYKLCDDLLAEISQVEPPPKVDSMFLKPLGETRKEHIEQKVMVDVAFLNPKTKEYNDLVLLASACAIVANVPNINQASNPEDQEDIQEIVSKQCEFISRLMVNE